MNESGVLGILLVIANLLVSYKGFIDSQFFDKYKFNVDEILVSKDYGRLITSGFLHGSWLHLIFNMVALYSFCSRLEFELGVSQVLIIYFLSLVGGGLFSLYVHRQHGDYSAIGASGAVCGIVFAAIALFPDLEVGFPGIDISIKGWIYAVLFLIVTIFGIKSGKGNIGHDAHLGGAVVGMLTALIMMPAAFSENLNTVLLILIPSIAFMILVLSKPEVLLVENYFGKQSNKYYDIDHKYNETKFNKQNEIDRLLEKINKKGIKSLSKKERDYLDDN